jgi:hypothetical protein
VPAVSDEIGAHRQHKTDRHFVQRRSLQQEG